MDLSLRSIQNQKAGQRITLKKSHLNVSYTRARDTVMSHWSADTFLDSFQLTMTWMFITKYYRIPDSICLGLHTGVDARTYGRIDFGQHQIS